MTWFQHHPDNPPPADEDETTQDWDAPETGEVEDAELVEDDIPEEMDEEDQPPAAEAPAPERRALDRSVAEVLRAEAERERAARAADTGSGLETQPELGLGEGRATTARHEPAGEEEKRSSEAQARMARLRGEDAVPDAEAEPDPGTRRNLLPDIDEINSSLDSDPTDPGMVETDNETSRSGGSGGFRRGFLSVILLAVIGLLLYVFAAQLAEAVPALDGVMSGYVGLIDAVRAQLDQLLSGGAG